ncbi:MAG: MmcQ/YjbR family DNA-binding protein [Bryobacteraceae bacterium]|jgi:predicted DNA-binding protein (MmcQ/YjbR family)
MDAEWVRTICLSLPGVTEEILWGGDLVFKAGGKMFCVVSLEPGSVWLSLKAGEEEFGELVERPGIVPAPYLARAKWVALESQDAMQPPELKERIVRSWKLVVARLNRRERERLMAQLDSSPSASA